jgi:pimeloyl-ACP methyl ester carboxylesterase
MPRVTVNGTELYHEVRGTGPPVLLIMGATGDGGHFDTLADLLADEFTVITYDRRGNGRSPVPGGWQTTSPEEQADDAAALLDALAVGPAAIFGTSSGGNFALCLLIRHPTAVRGAILHEPGLYALVDDFDAVRGPVRALVQEAMAAGGPPAAVERFWCFMTGEDGWDRLAPELRERMRATGTVFGVELGTYELYLPDDETLAAIPVPMRLLVSADGLPVFAEIAGRLGKRLGVDVARTPGRHDAYHEHPEELAEAVRPFLRQISQVSAEPAPAPCSSIEGGRDTAIALTRKRGVSAELRRATARDEHQAPGPASSDACSGRAKQASARGRSTRSEARPYLCRGPVSSAWS